MKEKVEAQINLAELIRAVDQRGVVEGVLSSHFLPDIMGNSRAFSKQKKFKGFLQAESKMP